MPILICKKALKLTFPCPSDSRVAFIAKRGGEQWRATKQITLHQLETKALARQFFSRWSGDGYEEWRATLTHTSTERIAPVGAHKHRQQSRRKFSIFTQLKWRHFSMRLISRSAPLLSRLPSDNRVIISRARVERQKKNATVRIAVKQNSRAALQ